MPGKDFIVFRDYYKFHTPSEEETIEWKDNLVTSPTSTHGLEVILEASHSGILNDNMKFYIPSRMEDGVHTFVREPKPLKILKNHDPHQDPLGVITGARYVNTVPEVLMDDKNVQVLLDSTNSVKKQIKAAKNFLATGIPLSNGWKGLGYVELHARILDGKAIRQIKDGRFDSVSTFFVSPGHAYCSECQANWAVDGQCEHELGQQYPMADSDDLGPPMALIPGVHKNKECSLVVFDADPLTTITLGHSDSKKEFTVPVEDWKKHNESYESKSYFVFKDFKEDNIMAKPNEKAFSDAENKVLAVVKELRPELGDEKLSELTVAIAATQGEDGMFPDQAEAEIDEKTAIQYALEDLETQGQEVNADENIKDMREELAKMKDEGLIDEEAFNNADAKLSSEGRKKLPKSTFCGPDRSFPVPDCAHVTAARRLIGRYKGPGNKSTILACVSRKEKALGCGSKDSAPAQGEETPAPPEFKLPACESLTALSNEDAQALFAMAEAELISRKAKVERECSKCAAAADEAKKAKDKVTEAEDAVKEKDMTLKVLREELQRQYADYAEQVDQAIDLRAQLYAAKVDETALKGVLTGKFKDLEAGKEALKENFEDQVAVITENFDLTAAAEKLNDGMARTPDGEVEDPTHNIDNNNNQLPEDLDYAGLEAITSIKDLVNEDKIGAAKSLYGRMVSIGVLDKEKVPFDSLSAVEKPAE